MTEVWIRTKTISCELPGKYYMHIRYHNPNFIKTIILGWQHSLGTYTTSCRWNATISIIYSNISSSTKNVSQLRCCCKLMMKINTRQNYISDRMTGNARSWKSQMPPTKPMWNHWKGANRMKTGSTLRLRLH